MRHRLLLGAVLALLAWPATGHADSGGASAGAPTGGAGYGVTPARLVASRFSLTPRKLQQGAPLNIRYRVDGTRRSVRVRIDVLPAGSRHPTARIRMGWKRTGRTLSRKWTPPAGRLTPGDYVVNLHAVDRRGRTLARTATASGRSRLTVVAPPAPPAPVPSAPLAPAVGSGVFPVQGSYTYGDGFGVKRGTATHRGQDILAAEGTPIVTPRAGVVKWRAYQATGAGYYLVVSADDGRDLVFMHFLAGSLTVDKGDTVSAGQVIGQVGQTGDATAPHLHFEIWPAGWYSSDDSQPIDPLPDLQAWAAS
jgi:murein DD-endopeptidase MepM/ murein hydrolase activator NlpD